MDAFLRKQASRRLLYRDGTVLPDRLVWGDLLGLWCPLDGTEQAKRNRTALIAELNQAVRAGSLQIQVEERTETRHAPAAGWPVPYGRMSGDLDELHTRTASRSFTSKTVWISREALRTWLASAGGWPPEEVSPLREWWPEEKWLKGNKAVLGEVAELMAQGASAGKAVKAVAARHGLIPDSLNKARKRGNPNPAKKRH